MTKNYLEGKEHLTIKMSQETRDEILKYLGISLTDLILNLRQFKPDNNAELARRFAIAITEAEKLDAYITQYILGPIGSNE